MYIPSSIPEPDKAAMIDQADFGSPVKFGNRVAILVIDMTREFVEGSSPKGFPETGKPAVRAISVLMEHAQSVGVRGYFSRSLRGDHRLKAGRWEDKSPGDQQEAMTHLVEGLPVNEDDVVFEKYKPSVFFGTQLQSMLNMEDVNTLIVTGMTTSGCVRATIIDAFSLNYQVFVPIECVADRSQISHEVNLFDIDMKYGNVEPLDDILDRLTEL